MTMLVDTRTARPAGSSRARLARLAIVAAAGVGGWWLGTVVRAPDRIATPRPLVAVGPMQLALAPEWTRAPGPDVRGAQSFAPVDGMPARALLVAGPAVDASLIPAALRAQLPTPLPAPRRAKLGGLPAWTYGPIRADGRVTEVTVAPTTVAVLAVACSAETETWSAALGCEAGVRSIASPGGDALVPAPDLAFRRRAPAVLRRLDGKRVAGRAALARGRRIAASHRLARAHRAAAAALAPFAAPGATAGTVAALRRTAASYDAFARARGRRGFIAARKSVTRAEAALAAALKRLGGP
jgi:hypothetical protein